MVTWREEARLCLYAVQFLTRLPVPAWVGHQEGDLERAVRYFPWVGALIGLIAGGVYAIAHLSLPGLVAAGLALTTSILLTGGFHEDGLKSGLACALSLGGRVPWTAEGVDRVTSLTRASENDKVSLGAISS